MTRNICIVITLGLAAAMIGCEERIISENYSPYTGLSGKRYSPPTGARVETRARANENGFQKAWNEIDQALFGWLKDDKPTTHNAVPPAQHYDPIWMRQ